VLAAAAIRAHSNIYDSHMPSRVGVHRLLFFSSCARNFDAKSKCKLCDRSYNIAVYSVSEKTEAKQTFDHTHIYKAGAI
jgi:hypothetical protein